MPTTRRKQAKTSTTGAGTTASTTRSQSKLSFNQKSARVTKPSVSDPNAKKAALASSKLSEPAVQADVVETITVPEPEPEIEDEVESKTTEEKLEQKDEEDGKSETEIDITTPKKQTAAQSSTPKSQTPIKSQKKKQKGTSVKDEKDTREAAAEKITDAQLKRYWKAEEDSRLAPRVHQSQVSLHEKILRHFDLSTQYGPCIGIPRLARWKRANTLGLNPPVEVLAVLLKEQDKNTSQGCGKLAYIDELAGGRVVLVE